MEKNPRDDLGAVAYTMNGKPKTLYETIWEQIMCLSCSLDRARIIAWVALLVASGALGLAAYAVMSAG